MTNQAYITKEAYNKLFAYAEAAKKMYDSEVGGYLLVKELDEGGLLIEDVLLPPQEVSGGGVDIIKGGSSVVKFDDLPRVKGWWHSHHNMSTFHSGTDDDTLDNKWDGETGISAKFAMSVVVAFPPRKMLCYVQYYKPIKLNKVEVPLEILLPEDNNLYATYVKEVEDRVKKKYCGWQSAMEDCDMKYIDGRWTKVKKPKAEKITTQGTQISGVTAQKFSEMEEDELLELITSESTNDDIEDAIMDDLRQITILEMKTSGVWDPKVYPDLEILRKKAIRYRDSLKKGKGRFKALKNVRMPSFLPSIGKDERTCVHQSYNERGRIICFFEGKNFDCEKCKHNLDKIKTKKDKKSSPPTKVVPEKPAKEQSIIQPLALTDQTEENNRMG